MVELVQSLCTLVTGDKGSGKTTWAAREGVPEYERQRKLGRLTVISPTDPEDIAGNADPLRALCGQVYELDDLRAAGHTRWADMLRAEPRLYVHVTASDPDRALGDLADAIRDAGRTLVVVDEAHELAHLRADHRFTRLWNSRKREVDVIAVTTTGLRRDGHSLNPKVWDHSNVRVCFQSFDSRAQARIAEAAPPLAPYVGTFKTPLDGGTPEYGIYLWDGRAQLVMRDGRRTPEERRS